jgi:hypothetical protein
VTPIAASRESIGISSKGEAEMDKAAEKLDV